MIETLKTLGWIAAIWFAASMIFIPFWASLCAENRKLDEAEKRWMREYDAKRRDAELDK